MALADARAICPRLATEPADAAADAALLARLALWASRYGPLVARDDPDGLFLDVTGCAHLFGGEAGLLADLAARLEKAGFTCRLAVAGTPLAAAALARFVRGANSAARIAPPAETRARLAPLPVGALRLDGETALLLERLGLKTIGALSEIPRAALERRFRSRAQGAHVLARLDEAFGRKETPLVPVRPLPLFSIRILYPEPALESLAVETGLDRLLGELDRLLEQDGLGARRLALTAHRVDGTAQSLEIGLARPSRERAHIARLFKEHLARLDPSFGIDALVLAALETGPLAPAQAAIEGEAAPSRESLARLVDRLANRLPGETPVRLAPQESHVPERAQVPCAATAVPAWPSADGRNRPFRLFARPEPMTAIAEIPDGPPLSFTWRRLVRRVARARGPERIAPEWWRDGEGEALRDYYEVEDTHGQRYWVYREGLYEGPLRPEGPRWYVHGLFG